jgi:putative NIF3 family GTP cyclohydrolase 1 type 2
MKIAGMILAAAALALPSLAQESTKPSAAKPPITAQQVIDRIKANVGIPWMAETVDTFKAGDPQTPLTGIAVTMMATMDVLQRAAANRENLIISHEPTFYEHEDRASELPQGEKDPVLAAKRAFIEKNHLVVWRFHDHQHRMKIDQVQQGNLRKLGWEKYQDAGNQYRFTIPETTVDKLAAELKTKLGISALRVVGDRSMKVSRLAFSPGAAGAGREIGALEMPDVQVLIVGETREWETVEYVADAVSEGHRKALIVLSHVPSEQSGMEECTQWLRTFVTEVPVEFVGTPDPFSESFPRKRE